MSWKPVFEMFKSEFELVERKKKALEELYKSHRISKSTYEYITNDLANAKIEIENRQKAFKERIASRSKTLKNQIMTLEMFLANLEMHYVVGEIQDEIYKYQNNSISLGIEASKRELNTINEILARTIPKPVSAMKQMIPTEKKKVMIKEEKKDQRINKIVKPKKKIFQKDRIISE